jgi:hypothetical protein
MLVFRCLGRSKESVHEQGVCDFLSILIFYGEELLAPCRALKWMTIPCRPSATACLYIRSYPSYLQAVIFIRSVRNLITDVTKNSGGTARGVYLPLPLSF